jgi:hypothetical protein
METAAAKYVESIAEIESLPQLHGYLKIKSSDAVDELQKQAEKDVKKFIDREMTPYTQNRYLFETISKLRSKRLMDEAMSMIGTGDGRIEKSTASAILKNVFERNQGMSMDDHMAEEMQHALNAYGKVALKRFIDQIPMICIHVMQQFPEKINDFLSNVRDDEIRALVVAPPEKDRKMKELEREIATLENGISAIKKLF